jgi:hypothetical protein
MFKDAFNLWRQTINHKGNITEVLKELGWKTLGSTIVNQFNACPHLALLEFFREFCRILRELRLLVHNLQANTAKLSKKAVL